MMRSLLRLLVLVLPVALGATMSAHHSYSATYDVRSEVTLDGTLAQLVYRNPHAFVHIEAPDAAGVTRRWAVEWAGTAQLSAQGVARDTLRVGDRIVVVGRPSRVSGDYRLLMLRLRRPSDGFSWGTRSDEVVD
jgi:hypothetical protein